MHDAIRTIAAVGGLLLLAGAAPAQQVSDGTLEIHATFPSQHVPARDVRVWLPDGYDGETPHAVLYMHDGQMLFDAETTWNGKEWGVDEVASQLMREGRVRPFIVVGIDNIDARRHGEYFPQRPFEDLPAEARERVHGAVRAEGMALFEDGIHSDAYLRFLVEELKPFIDTRYAVAGGPANTVTMGSSMGGLISLYALLEYPDVFGGAGCVSTHWPGIMEMDDNPVPDAFFDYLDARLPQPGQHRLYFDLGDQTLDALYPPLQDRADEIMKENGWGPGDWQTHRFPGDAHEENAWRDRLHIPLTFLLPPAGAKTAENQ